MFYEHRVSYFSPMRIDKFLWCVRKYKTRSLASEALRKDRVTISKSRIGAKLVPDFIVDSTSPEELEKLTLATMMQKLSRARGTGRPTKKDRRDLNDFMEDEE
jgi:ribosome-associated heat shock protein Hsp15